MGTARQKAEALELYEIAAACDSGWQEAAIALAAALMPAAKPAPAEDLSRPLKIGRRAKHWGSFVVGWADGSETRVSGVVYDRPQDREAAAFQAADRLRRLRLRHGWEGEAAAPPRWVQSPFGLRIESAPWWEFVKRRQLPPLASITQAD